MHKNRIPRAIALTALAFSELVFGASPSPETKGVQVSFYGCDDNGCANLSANSDGHDGQVFLQLSDTSYGTLLVICLLRTGVRRRGVTRTPRARAPGYMTTDRLRRIRCT